MNPLSLPWLEMSIALTLLGSLWVSRVREPIRAFRAGLILTGTAFTFTVLAWLRFYLRVPPGPGLAMSPQYYFFGRQFFALDELNAPLVPFASLVHFLTMLATARTKMRRYSFTWSLAAETIRVATFSCKEPWLLIGLLAASTIPPYIELAARRRPARLYLIHMGLFIGLLVIGWSAVEIRGRDAEPSAWATIPLLLATLVRCGTIPAHCWVMDWFENSTFGIALLFVTPLSGVYAAVRLVLPIAPDWVLHSISIASLITAVYSAGMATIETEVRRFYARMFVSHASLVLVGLELDTVMSLTGSFCLWFSVILSLAGFGLTLRAIESRFGRLSLRSFHGLYEHSPALAVCFLLTGLGIVGFPGTLGFISTELLVDSAVEVSPIIGIAIVAAAALNGIAVVRAYLHLFAGAQHYSTVWLGMGTRERIAVLSLSAMMIGGGLYPQPGVTTRERAAEEILEERARHIGGRGAESAEVLRPRAVRPATIGPAARESPPSQSEPRPQRSGSAASDHLRRAEAPGRATSRPTSVPGDGSAEDEEVGLGRS